MFYHFILPFQEQLSFLRLFQYTSFRALYAAIFSLIFVLIIGRKMINFLISLKFREEIKEIGPEWHKSKSGTPTMGGIIIITAILFSIFLWGNFSVLYVWLLIAVTIIYGAIGFIDDYMKSVKKVKDGMPGKVKFVLLFGFALACALIVYYFPTKIVYFTTGSNPHVSDLFVPFYNKPVTSLMFVWVIFAILVITGASNAVNLTDGLDGLAVGSVLIVTLTLGIMSFVSGNMKIAEYLGIPYIAAAAEMTVFLSAVCGSCLGFLWYNSNPASVFMGDTGSLSLGGIIGVVAIMIKKEFFLVLVGGIFVVEVLSVILQVASFKIRGKRIFKMAPLHHHFEMSGWPEQKVVVRMWLIGIILTIIGLSTLKIL